jgi:hypothetical protein
LTRIRFPRRGLISAVGSRSRVRQCPFPSVDEPEPGSSLLALGVNCQIGRSGQTGGPQCSLIPRSRRL